MDNIDFATLPDAEAARLMAEMDGWCNVYIKEDGGEPILLGYHDKCADMFGPYLGEVPNYHRSLDAAVGWLGRMGLIWQRKAERHDKYWVDVFWGAGGVHCEESDTCPTSRALCNAGWAAVQAREAK